MRIAVHGMENRIKQIKGASLIRYADLIDTDHITPKQAGGNNSQDNLQLLHKHCHDAKTKSDLKVIKLYKAKKEGDKTQRWFNNLNWKWVDDIPTLLKVGTQTEPEKRGAQ